jgi:phytoene synthase
MKPGSSEQITRASKSNLAATFLLLDRERRLDMSTLYAFCRVVDDLADDDPRPADVRRAELALWKESLARETPGEPALARAVREMARRRQIAPDLLAAIIDGVLSDLGPVRFETHEALARYCWRVASAVGLASIEIFGYRDPACREYAEHLGMALQLTNILRDVGPDYTRHGRIYLPGEEMRKYGVAESDIGARETGEPLRALLKAHAARARDFFSRAERALPGCDRRSMAAAEMMRRLYRSLLEKIERGGFRVLECRFRVGFPGKIDALARTLLDRARPPERRSREPRVSGPGKIS